MRTLNARRMKPKKVSFLSLHPQSNNIWAEGPALPRWHNNPSQARQEAPVGLVVLVALVAQPRAQVALQLGVLLVALPHGTVRSLPAHSH